MSSYTFSDTQSFTLTHAKYLASKVAADLKRMQRFYGYPNDFDIASYESELTEYLRCGYLSEVAYGFKRNDKWIEPTLKYTARELAGLNGVDDDPGRIQPNADISGASFHSFLISNDKYHNLDNEKKARFKQALPFQRGSGNEPGISGYLSSDKSYSAGGRSLNRSSVKNF
jgi:hypothetical protein